MASDGPGGQTPAEEPFTLRASPGFADWLRELGASLAFTTYQAAKLFLVGAGPGERLAVSERTLARCMGLAASPDGRALLVATHHQIVRFDNVVPAGLSHEGADAVYAPHTAWITGAVDAHDVGFGADGGPVFVNTRFSCLAAPSPGFSFRPLWRPPFVSALLPEDRCHLNGMAMDGTEPAYVTMAAAVDEPNGWRESRVGGGVVFDLNTDEPVLRGLTMPHSPRLHDGRLWLVNSGTGELGFADTGQGRFEPVAFCPGFARGLSLHGRFALVGLSAARREGAFDDLPLAGRLKRQGTEARCGLLVIDTVSGRIIHWLAIGGLVRELYDVLFLPGVRRSRLIGFMGDEIHHVIAVDDRGLEGDLNSALSRLPA